MGTNTSKQSSLAQQPASQLAQSDFDAKFALTQVTAQVTSLTEQLDRMRAENDCLRTTIAETATAVQDLRTVVYAYDSTIDARIANAEKSVFARVDAIAAGLTAAQTAFEAKVAASCNASFEGINSVQKQLYTILTARAQPEANASRESSAPSTVTVTAPTEVAFQSADNTTTTFGTQNFEMLNQASPSVTGTRQQSPLKEDIVPISPTKRIRRTPAQKVDSQGKQPEGGRRRRQRKDPNEQKENVTYNE